LFRSGLRERHLLRRDLRGGRSVSFSLEAVSQRYITDSGEVVHALADTTLSVQTWSFVCVVGPSGCGKTTLLKILAGFLKPTGGIAAVDGEPLLGPSWRSEEHTSELQSRFDLVCRLLLEKKNHGI